MHQVAICSLVESPLWEIDMESLILEFSELGLSVSHPSKPLLELFQSLSTLGEEAHSGVLSSLISSHFCKISVQGKRHLQHPECPVDGTRRTRPGNTGRIQG